MGSIPPPPSEPPPPPWVPTDKDVARVLRLVAKLLPGYPHAHEDIAQEVLLKAFRSPSPGVELRAWLYGIANNAVKDWLQSETRQQKTAAAAPDPEKDAQAPSSEDDYIAAQTAHTIQTCLNDLPPSQRDILFQSLAEDVPMSRIAADLGICEPTGYTRLRKSRQTLLAALTRYLAKHRLTKEDLTIPVLLPFWLEDDSASALEPVRPAGDPKDSRNSGDSIGSPDSRNSREALRQSFGARLWLGLRSAGPWWGGAGAAGAAAAVALIMAAPWLFSRLAGTGGGIGRETAIMSAGMQASSSLPGTASSPVGTSVVASSPASMDASVLGIVSKEPSRSPEPTSDIARKEAAPAQSAMGAARVSPPLQPPSEYARAQRIAIQQRKGNGPAAIDPKAFQNAYPQSALRLKETASR